MHSELATHLRRAGLRVFNPYLRGHERLVRRAVRAELNDTLARLASAAGPDPETLEKERNSVAEMQSHIQALEEQLQVSKDTYLAHVGLNQASFRSNVAYKNYGSDAVFVNIGAGDFYHPRWTNLDVPSFHYDRNRTSHYKSFDLNDDRPIPFKTGSVSLAYTSHVIEHVKDHAAVRMFEEAHRILANNGIFRVTCPDAHLYYRCAQVGQLDRFFYRMNTWFRRHGVDESDVGPVDFISKGVATGIASTPLIRDSDHDLDAILSSAFDKMERDSFLDYLCSHVEFSIDHVARHINWWSHAKVVDALRRAGFDDVWISSFGGSMAAPMCDTRLFDNTVRDESLYVEARKHA